ITTENKIEKISTRGNKLFYVTYFDAGYTQTMKPDTVSIKKFNVDYNAIWMNPSTGEVLLNVRLPRGSDKLQRPGYRQDIVLLLKKSN
ncbi:MAG: hypothetical protein JKX98_10005, partial [Alcanivoracaceae bacterium]|nr:hypothetical protein [Alcanivoracaceae bacterium]